MLFNIEGTNISKCHAFEVFHRIELVSRKNGIISSAASSVPWQAKSIPLSSLPMKILSVLASLKVQLMWNYFYLLIFLFEIFIVKLRLSNDNIWIRIALSSFSHFVPSKIKVKARCGSTCIYSWDTGGRSSGPIRVWGLQREFQDNLD